MKIKLRDYQKKTVLDSFKSLRKHDNVLVCSPTGSGKTIMFAYMTHRLVKHNKKVLILSNRQELLKQADGALSLFDIDCDFINPKNRSVPTKLCAVGTTQSLRRRVDKKEWQEYLSDVYFVIIDEIHQQDFNYLFKEKIIENSKVAGFTATPIRTGGQRQLGLDFEDIVMGVSVKELIDMGYLVSARHFSLDAPDLSKLEYDKTRGDYNNKSLSIAFDNPKMYGGILSNYRDHCDNTKAICFCVSQIHAVRTCKMFNQAGVRSKFLVSGIGPKSKDYEEYIESKHLTGDRDTILEEFKNGDIQVLCNTAILTTGFDEPSIETVIVNRATASLSLWLQMIGRGSRLFKNKKEFNILDFGNNLSRHGFYEKDRGFSLWHEESEGGGIAMTKECPKFEKDSKGKLGCGRLVHIGMTNCPFCGWIFKTPEEMRIVELKEIVGDFKIKDMNPSQLLAYAELNNYHKAWVFRQLYLGAEKKRDFVNGMKELGYNFRFIYSTYNRIHEQQKARERKELTE